MRIALIADTFPPLRTSGAVQLRDLSREFVRQGHNLTVLLPSSTIQNPWQIEDFDGARVIRLKAPQTKDIGYIRRTIAEFMLPFAMLKSLRKSPVANESWDGIVWYSPSIFFGPLVDALKHKSKCKGYLIIRDIFPEWAVDMGLMGRGIPYKVFRAVANQQYSVANIIGVQTPGNLKYFEEWSKAPGRKVEVLPNWLDKPATKKCSIRIDQTPISGRTVFVYAGNMGIAQGMDIVLELAKRFKQRDDVGFLFVGRGSEVPKLKSLAQQNGLTNVVFFDEIDPDEIPDLYSQCSIGIVALDPRHKSHNIPGKFLTYMQSGLPVLANVNAGNDLAHIIRHENVGQVCESNDIEELYQKSLTLIEQIKADRELSERCQKLFFREFFVESTVKQIVASLMNQ